MLPVSILNVLETRNVRHGLTKPVIGLVIALMSFENNSLTMSQGIGPKPRANEIMNMLRDVKGNHPTYVFIIRVHSSSASRRKKNNPRAVRESVMTVIESKSNILRPALSTKNEAAIVAIKFTDPIIIVEMSALKLVSAS